MPRIRSIKPEFWDSPSTTRASAVARLLYIAMWNWADDYGRGTGNLKELEGFAFPYDDVHELSGGKSRNFRHTAQEVSDCFGVVFYTVRGRPYYAIPSWDQHQRTERKARSKYPGPDEADAPPDMGECAGEGSSDAFLRPAEEGRGGSGIGTGEQGNRGTGEQGNLLSSADAPDESAPNRSPYSQDFLTWWEHYPRKESKGAAFKAWKQIRDRHLPTLTAAADRYAQDPNREPQFTKLPASWLNARAWEDETPLPARQTRGGSRMAQVQSLKRGGASPWNGTGIQSLTS